MVKTDNLANAMMGVDDAFWHGVEGVWWRSDTMTESQAHELRMKYPEYCDTRDALIAAGFDCCYGGTKGHGFWIRDQQKPDDGETGNPSFWSIAECRTLLEGKPRVLPVYAYDTTSGSPSWSDFIEAMRSGEPVEIDEEMWDYWLEVLPPVYMNRIVCLRQHPQIRGPWRQVRAVFGFAEGEEFIVAFWKSGKRRYCCQTPEINQ